MMPRFVLKICYVLMLLLGNAMAVEASNNIEQTDTTDIICIMPPCDLQDSSFVGDTLGNAPELVKKLTDFQTKMLKKVADLQQPKSSGSKFKVVFMPPPLGSSPEYGFGLGAGVCGLFKTGENPLLYTSSIPLNVRFGFTDPFSYRIQCTPILYFNGNSMKLSAAIRYSQLNEYYYGIGYSTNKALERDRSVTGYQSRCFEVLAEIQWRLGKSDVYVGILGDFGREKIKSAGTYLLDDASYIDFGGTESGLTLTDVGFGVNITYDTRDVSYAPYDGIYIDAKAVYYGKALGSDSDYGKIQLDYRHYRQIGAPRCVLSWGISSSNVVGKTVPFARYATIGDIYNTRGYYGNQYRDKSVLKVHAEYRYMLNINNDVGKLILNRFGIAGWTGLALIGENVLKYNGVLPEVGAGLRMQIAPRVNMYFDLGYDFNDRHVLKYFGITETF